MIERAHILVVDDEVGPRESLRMLLKPNYDVLTVDSGEAALQELGRFHPDLVFMDIKMPSMDGVEVLRRMKANDPAIEVVMITAYASLDTVKHALTHGAFEYLIKPFSRKDLEETVNRALLRRQAEIGRRGQLAMLAQEMRELTAKTRELEEAARREVAEQCLRVVQLSILREISRGILGQLDLSQLTESITQSLRVGLGYDEVAIHFGGERPAVDDGPTAATCPIRSAGAVLGYLTVNNRPSARAIDPREHELLEMLSEYLAIAIQNSRLYGQIAETKQSLEQLIRSAGEAIISVDRSDRILAWNPAAERIFAASEAEMLGTPITGVLPEASYRQAKAALSAERPVHSYEARAPRRGGGEMELAVTLSALRGGNGQVEGILAIVRDVTSQRELEAQMLQSEKLTALGQLAGGIAHDFNNLLQAILGYAELMARNPDRKDLVRRGLEVIERAASDGSETVRRIQEFARLRPIEAFTSVDLNQVIGEAVAITRPRWEQQAAHLGIRLELVLDLPPLPLVLGRPAALSEVFTNLILNAIDAMPNGGVLRISTADEGTDWVAVEVSDTGTGMPEEVRRRIFDPFYTTKGEAGTGLGLSVSYSIIKNHGGEIRVESQVGRGTSFTVRLPTSQAPEGEPPRPEGPERQRQGRILLIDNEPQVLAVLCEMLVEAGHAVTPTVGGADAVAAYAPGKFDLVVSNIGMPGVNGWEVAERVRAMDPNVPMIFVTGWGLTEKDRERCRTLGVRHWLFKPVKPAELHRTVQDALAH
ncbi:MAG: response regulator [Candidatus Rokubacteria bacterium]|nr:response regulator [Candidatus Rokubacteria bacterium]